MTKNTQPKSGSEIFVPLNMLKKSPRNVRKGAHAAAEVEALAASIAIGADSTRRDTSGPPLHHRSPAR